MSYVRTYVRAYQQPASHAAVAKQGRRVAGTHFCLHPLVTAGLAGFKSEDATSIDADPVTDLTLEGGFTMHHGGYEKKNAGMVAKRIWMPPCHVKCVPSVFLLGCVVIAAACCSAGQVCVLQPAAHIPQLCSNAWLP